MGTSAYKSRLLTTALRVFIVVAMGLGIYQGVRAQGVGTVQVLEQQLYFSHAFEEPLVPMGPTTAAEDKALLHAVTTYKATRQPADFDAIQVFLKRYPHSVWRVALFTNEGLVDYRAGYFDRAIASYSEAWRLGKNATGVKQKALVDRAFGELIRMHARLGHADKIAKLLKEIKDRPMIGVAAEWVSGAKEGLYEMRHNPGIAYLCGPMAVKNVLLTLHPHSKLTAILDAYRSGSHGVDLATVARLTKEVGLDYRMAYRKDPNTNLPLPAIVHWRVNHYAAIIGFSNGRYRVEDPTFGGNGELWITPRVLAAESDGYYLIPADASEKGWATVSDATSKSVYGMGSTGSSYPYATTYNDLCACQRPIGSSKSDHTKTGMPQADALAMLVSLRITDTPLSYTPPVGPAIRIVLTYNQKEATQTENLDYGNLGPGWGMNWISYIVENPADENAPVDHDYGGGGKTTVDGCGSWNCTLTADVYGYVLSRTRTNGNDTYTLTYPDGRIDTFALNEPEGPDESRIFLTRVTDPQGNAVVLDYDGQYRLLSLTNSIGQVTSFGYNDPYDSLKIAVITDPFGEQISDKVFIDYSDDDQLLSIQDEIGQISYFGYEDNTDFINSMHTPYGYSSFAYGESTHVSPNTGLTLYDRWLTLTDPLGHQQRVEYDDQAPGVPDTDPAGCPPGMETCANEYMVWRNSFYWSAINPYLNYNYTTAENFHWLHLQSDTNMTSGIPESIKQPLQNRVWFAYPGQDSFHQSGTLASPSEVGVRLPSGGEVTRYTYNNFGNATCYADPAGRVTKYDYASNGIDLVGVRQGTGGNSCNSNGDSYGTVAQYSYNTQHEPLSYTDAAGQTTTYTYNAAGQVATVKDALNETTTYAYNGGGYLFFVTGPDGQPLAQFSYDYKGRVASATDAGGETVGYYWDDLNRLTETNDADCTRNYYYHLLDLDLVFDCLRYSTTYDYDADRNLISFTDPLNNTTQLYYDGDGNLTSLTSPTNGGTTIWNYDTEDRLTSKTYSGSGEYFHYYYTDAAGWLDHVVDPLGQTTQYSYTVDGRIAAISYPGTQTPEAAFVYDPYYPRVVSMTDGTGTTAYSYYPAGQLGANRLQAVMVPSPQAVISYAYDVLGRVAARTIDSNAETFGYDVLGRLSRDKNVLANFTYGYLNETDQVTSVTPDSGPFSVTYQYEDNVRGRRLKAVLNKALVGTYAPQSFQYQTNADNLVTSSAVTRGGSLVQGFSYDYDGGNRLTSVRTTSGANASYLYNNNGNLLKVIASGPTVLFNASYNALNQIIKANHDYYSYDAAGELINDGTNTYSWDATHRLVNVSNIASGNVTSYTYDGLGRRVAITTHSPGHAPVTMYYLWCAHHPCQARDANNNVAAQYFTEGEQRGNTALLYGRDRLGSVTDLVVRATGFVIASYTYDPWGNVTNTTGGYSASFGYAGMFNDSSTGRNLTLYRAYNPAQYRWLSRDPMGESIDNNLYRYVFDNPSNLTDRLGLQGGQNDWGRFVQTITNYQTPPSQSIENAYSQNPAWQAYGPDPANACNDMVCLAIDQDFKWLFTTAELAGGVATIGGVGAICIDNAGPIARALWYTGGLLTHQPSWEIADVTYGPAWEVVVQREETEAIEQVGKIIRSTKIAPPEPIPNPNSPPEP